MTNTITLDDWTQADADAAIREGWNVADSDGSRHGTPQLQHIDAMDVCDGEDAGAWAHVREQAAQQSPLHVKALAILQRENPAEYARIMAYAPARTQDSRSPHHMENHMPAYEVRFYSHCGIATEHIEAMNVASALEQAKQLADDPYRDVQFEAYDDDRTTFDGAGDDVEEIAIYENGARVAAWQDEALDTAQLAQLKRDRATLEQAALTLVQDITEAFPNGMFEKAITHVMDAIGKAGRE
jgi:hypothetical protein